MPLIDSAELWKPISDYPKYWISTWGRVRNNRFNRILKPSKPSNGYLQVNVSNHNHRRSKCIHQLMASTFLGPKPHKFEVSHVDDDKENNKLSNLEYVHYKKNRRKRSIFRFCVICGKLIPGAARNSKTCSIGCNFLSCHIEVECNWCGEKFYRGKSVVNGMLPKRGYSNNKKHYCSRKCYGSYWGKTYGWGSEAGKNRLRNPKGKKVECKQCGHVWTARVKSPKVCSGCKNSLWQIERAA